MVGRLIFGREELETLCPSLFTFLFLLELIKLQSSNNFYKLKKRCKFRWQTDYGSPISSFHERKVVPAQAGSGAVRFRHLKSAFAVHLFPKRLVRGTSKEKHISYKGMKKRRAAGKELLLQEQEYCRRHHRTDNKVYRQNITSLSSFVIRCWIISIICTSHSSSNACKNSVEIDTAKI